MKPTKASVSYQRVRDLIRADIVSGELLSGTRLKIPVLCARYDASAIPVREALQALSGEGLVVIEPNRGATVRPVNAAFVEDIYEIRRVLEVFIVRRFVEVASVDDIATVSAIQQEMEAHEDAGDLVDRHVCDIRFHRTIAGVIDNSEVGLIVDRHTNIIDAVMRKFGQTPMRIAQVRNEHRALLKAFGDRNLAEAERVISEHFANARRDIGSLMRIAARREAG